MPTIVNLLNDQTSFLSNYSTTGIGSWVAASNGTIQRTSKRAKTGLASLLVTGTSNGQTTTVTSHDATTAPEVTPGDTYRALIWFHHETVGRSIRFGIQYYDSTRTAITYADFVTVQQGFSEWTLASLTMAVPVGARYAALRIDIDSVNTSGLDKFLWLEDAGLVTYGTIKSRFLDLYSRWIPEWMIVDDFNQTSPTFPMMRFVDLAGMQVDEVLDLISDFHYIPEVDGGPIGDTSSLVDPANYLDIASGMTTKPEWLPWLGQLVGIRNTSLALESGTSWDYLQTTFTSWTAWESNINAAATTPRTISSLSRTAGVVSITTSVAHGLEAGDVVTVAGTAITTPAAADVSFDGYYEVLSASGTNFTYSQEYLILSAVRAGTTVTVTTGRPHGFAVNNTVTLANCSIAAFNGTFTVTSVSQVGDDGGNNTFTFTTGTSGAATSLVGTVRPATDKAGTGGTATPSDLKWSFIEKANAQSFDPVALTAEFIRTGANGVWSGTIEGMKRAARAALTGIDIPCSLTRINGTITGTTATPHGFTTGSTVTVYGSKRPSLNRSYTITSTGTFTFTLTSGGTDLTNEAAWITNIAVSVTRGFWNGTIDTVTVASGNAYTVTFTSPFPAATASGTVTIAGSAATAVNATHTPTGSITVSADRLSISFTSNQVTSPQSSLGGKAKLAVDNSTFVVGTTKSQSPGDQTIIDFVNIAKPAGAIITHEYTA